MPLFLIRVNCEYSIEVEAPDADAALRSAELVDLEDWSQAWSEAEVEQV